MNSHESRPVSPQVSAARDFAAAMGRLASEGQAKGYIKKIATNEGHTYVYERGSPTSGKMTAKDLVQTANTFAQEALSVGGTGLQATDLQNIQRGMEKLYNRLSSHHGARSLFKQLFVRINYLFLANSVVRPEYQRQLTDKLHDATFRFTTNENALNGYCETITMNCLNQVGTLAEAKDNYLIGLFLHQHPGLDNLRGFIGDEAFKGLIKGNNSFKTASQNLNARLENHFRDQVDAQLRAVIQDENRLSECEANPQFNDLIRKYKDTFPAHETRTSTEIVQDLTGITLKGKAKAKPESSASSTQPTASEKSKKPSRLQRVRQRLPGGRKAKKTKASSSQEVRSNVDIAATSQVASSSERPRPLTTSGPFASLVLKLDPNNTVEDRVHNGIRQKLLNAIMHKIDRDVEKPENFDSYMSKSIHGYYPRVEASSLSSEEKDRLEGENSLTHMFYLYRHLILNPSKDQRMVELKEDLERSIPFAFESIAIGGRDRDKEDRLAAAVYEELAKMKEGARLFLPTGCEGHATLLMMTKTGKGKVEVEHFNTGYGMEEHAKIAIKSAGEAWDAAKKALFKKQLPIAISLTVDLRAKDQIQRAIAGFVALSDVEGTTMGDLREGFKILERAGSERIKVSVSREGQRAGNCSYDCLLAAFEKVMGEDSYQNFQRWLIGNLEKDYQRIPEGRKNRNDARSLATLAKQKQRL